MRKRYSSLSSLLICWKFRSSENFSLGMSTFAFLTHCRLLILSFLYKSQGFEESREIVLHAKHEHQPEAIRHLPVVLESFGVFIPQLDL